MGPFPFFLGDVDMGDGAGTVAVAVTVVEAPLAEAETQGVWRWGWRNPGVALTAVEGPARGGNRLTWTELDDAEGTVLAPETCREVEDDELAACATRSHTCREDCGEDRDAVTCLALRTRPLVIPAYPDPTAVGTRSGNC